MSIYHLLFIPPVSIYRLHSLLSFFFSNPALVVFCTYILWLPTTCPALLQHYFGDSTMRKKPSLKPLGQYGTDWEIRHHVFFPTESTELWLWGRLLGSYLGRRCVSYTQGDREPASPTQGTACHSEEYCFCRWA